MSLKITAIVALALLGTIAVYHVAQHHDSKHHSHANTTLFTTSNATNESHYVPNFVMMYQGYKLKNNLKFGAAEDSKRMDVFIKNAKVVQAHNAKKSSYKLGLTPLAHLTLEEFSALKLGYKSNKKVAATTTTTHHQAVHVVKGDDKTVDWSGKGAITPVKNQGSCGSCWAFSTTGALEGLNFIKNNKLVALSEQELVDCSTSYGNQGCNGGLMDQGFQYVADKGIASEESYPYTGVDGNCKTKEKVFQTKGFEDVAQNDPEALVKALDSQPVSVAIEADTSAFQLYSEGVITGDACGSQLDHGVLAVGYGSLDGKAYFKVKNSWGPEWGNKGYVLIGKASGAGVCGINSAASYPTL